ncbi:MAG TPA: sugar ABC transporter substrate-binding protein [Candidatus Acidoferrum sp.]|nr:sugar ABC transporter substrate-binding protein [Candidatus Acidoferrum sp.]
MNRIVTLTLAVLVVAFSLATPAAPASPEPVYKLDTKVKPAKLYAIAVVLKNFTNPFWLTHQKAAEQAAKDLGVKVTVLAPTKPDNVEEQIRILEDLISKKVDAIVVAPANTQAIAAGVQKLNAAKIPVVYDNTRGSGGEFVAYIGADNVLVGRTMAEEMVKRMGGKGKLLVLEGFPGQQTADDRLKGVKEVLAKNPTIEYVSQTGKWTLDEGRNVTENTLQRWPDLKAILCIGGEMALGAAEAVKAADKEGKIIISSMDVYPAQVAALKAGKVNFTISQAPQDQAYWSVVAAIRSLNGEKVPQEIRTPVVIVTKENVDKYAEQ